MGRGAWKAKHFLFGSIHHFFRLLVLLAPRLVPTTIYSNSHNIQHTRYSNETKQRERDLLSTEKSLSWNRKGLARSARVFMCLSLCVIFCSAGGILRCEMGGVGMNLLEQGAESCVGHLDGRLFLFSSQGWGTVSFAAGMAT